MRSIAPLLALAAGAALSLPSLAQQPANPTSPMTTPTRAPWYGGISVGKAELKNSCVTGFACDDKDAAFRAFAGTRFNNILGVELGALNIGKYTRGGGETDGWAADLAATAGVPLGANSSVFAKLGAVYARTETSAIAPGLPIGKERGWGARWGVGGQMGLSQNWALRADWDRFEIPFPGQKEDLDMLSVGVQYSFR